jgi:hypothetical protein
MLLTPPLGALSTSGLRFIASKRTGPSLSQPGQIRLTDIVESNSRPIGDSLELTPDRKSCGARPYRREGGWGDGGPQTAIGGTDL